jgi:hypothetical protein
VAVARQGHGQEDEPAQAEREGRDVQRTEVLEDRPQVDVTKRREEQERDDGREPDLIRIPREDGSRAAYDDVHGSGAGGSAGAASRLRARTRSSRL